MAIPFIEENDQTRARRDHTAALRALVGNVYPNKFNRSRVVDPGREDTITAIWEKFRHFEPRGEGAGQPVMEEIELANQQLNKVTVRLAGRLASPPRVMGKAAFVHLSDGKSRLQIYARKADVSGARNDGSGEAVDGWELFSLLDHGDFIGVEGYLFVTKTGELSIHVKELQFLAKALLPMPDKMHGIHDPEIRQRQRYADLIAGSLKLEREEEELMPRAIFERRSEIVSEMRRFLEDHGYVEVETPILSPLATGALARPFKTHHNALHIDLYARIAPELYLKRLLVGGFERVYELNRNFRNEGIDRMHNPEFTMLEFYAAYMDVNGMMDFCEEMIRATVFKVLGHTHVRFGEHDIDFLRPFHRLTMKQAIAEHWPDIWQELDANNFGIHWLEDPSRLSRIANFVATMEAEIRLYLEAQEDSGLSFETAGAQASELIKELQTRRKDEIWRLSKTDLKSQSPAENGALIQNLFERFAEPKLIQPTFITDFPKPISPLSKASPADPSVAERFEFFVGTLETANGFSELNDPEEQFTRFQEQVEQRKRGDEEAMVMDEDYIRALSYGMPPAAGIGIGIDRFVMLLTNRQNIRDVILFPHMRPERPTEGTPAAALNKES